MQKFQFICGLLFAGSLFAFPLIGCQTKPPTDYAPELTLDPTHEVPLIGWWYNGTQVLRLEDNSQYQLFADTNRYARPLSNGRWSQKTYATLFLSPYNTPTSMRQRLTIARDGEDVTLEIPGYATFSPWDPHNATGIKELSTQWRSAAGTLDLRSDQRYVYRPVPNSNQAMSEVGHGGVWTLEDRIVNLFPDPQGVDELSFEIRQQSDSDDTLELWSESVIHFPASD